MSKEIPVWLRAGITIMMSEEDARRLVTDKEAGYEILPRVLSNGKFMFDGETYLPEWTTGLMAGELDMTVEEFWDNEPEWHLDVAPFEEKAQIEPASLVRSRATTNVKFTRSVDSVMAAIHRAAAEGNFKTVFAPFYAELYDSVKTEFEGYGYTFRPIGCVDGIWQDGQYICW